jgi:hypothetical protein
MFIMKQPVSLQSRDIQQLLGKLLKFVCNWRGKVFWAAAARGDRVAKGAMYTERPKHFPASITNKLWEFS